MNNVSKTVRTEQERYTVAAFYQFAPMGDKAQLQSLQAQLQELCLQENLRGTLILAHEGVNSTVSGPAAGVRRLIETLRTYPGLDTLEVKYSEASRQAFHRMKVKIKPEIVTLRVPYVDPSHKVGRYLSPQDWDALIADPRTLVLDTRNSYEYEAGTFQGAINPNTRSFCEFPAYVAQHLAQHKDRPIATFCTGGIRCEKATSYLLEQGFTQVYHLKGGILKYLETVPREKSSFQGECFVFDQRVTVKHGLQEGSYRLCYGCQYPVSPADQQSAQYQPGICCPRCHSQLTPQRRKALENRQHQIDLCRQRGQCHIGY